MEKEFLRFPSIEQFRNVIRNVKSKAHYVGKDENGDPIYDGSRPLPTLKFTGTVKLHGTNAGICYDVASDTISYQSRERVLSLTQDNAGFMLTQMANEAEWRHFFTSWKSAFPDIAKIIVFGEWCGGNIQKGVAITGLPKMFVVFSTKTIFKDGTSNWIEGGDCGWDIPGVYDIKQFPTWEMEIDFNFPELAQNKMIDLTIDVETECPVGKHFGVSGIGEGIVWKCLERDWQSSSYWFKVKGEAHVKGTSIEGLNLSANDRMKVINFCLENGIKEFDYYFSE